MVTAIRWVAVGTFRMLCTGYWILGQGREDDFLCKFVHTAKYVRLMVLWGEQKCLGQVIPSKLS